MNISVQNFKIIMVFVMFLISLLGILPLRIPAITKSEARLSYLNCFSAGMFMAIALIHMLPESVEDYEKWVTEENIIRPFPLPFCCVFIGYIIVLCVDRVIMHNIMEKYHGHHHHN